MFAEQVVELFGALAAARDAGPRLAVASFVNPHDIGMSGLVWEEMFRFGPPDDTVPEIPEPPSQDDAFSGRPPCQQFEDLWPQMLYQQPADLAYRRLYYYLHKGVDRAIARILESLQATARSVGCSGRWP